MARGYFRQAQVSFTAGEISPQLKARKDTQMFYLACEKLTNCIVQPEGSADVRPGSWHVATLHNDAAHIGCRLIPFVFNEAQKYVVALTPLSAKIFSWPDNQLVGTLTTTWNEADLAELDWLQLRDTLLVVDQFRPVRAIARQANGAFTLADYAFERPPQHRYQAGTIRLQADATTGSINLVSLDGPAFLAAGVGDIWTFQGIAVRLTEIGPLNVAAVATVLSGTIPNTNPSTDWMEQAHSAVRGYYRSIAYFQDRLWLGGSRGAPTELWGSRIAAPYDFLSGGVNDADPVKLPASSGRADPIRYLAAGTGGLEVYTSGEEAIIPGGVDQPITPKTLAYVPQSAFGSRQVKPVRLESATLFVQRDGGAIRQMVYSNVQQSYAALTMTVRAAHLTADPIRMTVAPGAFGAQTTFVPIVNRDGTGAILTSESSQEVTAWSQWLSKRSLMDVCAVGSRVYIATRSGGKIFLEYLSEDAIFDAQHAHRFSSRTTTLTGMTSLASTVVEVFADGYWLGEFKVNANGSLTLPRGYFSVDVGLQIEWRVQPMPVDSAQSSMLGQKLRPMAANLRFQSSAGIRVNGRVIYDRPFRNATGTPPQQTSDVRRVTLQGWSRGNSCPVEVTRDGPFPIRLLALAVDYRVGDR